MIKSIIKRLPGIRSLVAERNNLREQLEEMHGIKVEKILGSRRYCIPQYLAKTDREAWLNPVYRAIIEASGGTFIDVGANKGQTLIKLLTLDFRGPYIGFEPQIKAAALIDEFLHDNDLSEFNIFAIGLADTVGACLLQSRGSAKSAQHSEVASIISGFRPEDFYTTRRFVCTVPGDAILEALGTGRIGVVKIDVEGAELEVVRGMIETLERHKPIVLFEVLNNVIRTTQERLSQEVVDFRRQRVTNLESRLRSIGFKVFNIAGQRGLVEVDKIELLWNADATVTNYLAIAEGGTAAFMRAYENAKSTQDGTEGGNGLAQQQLKK